MQGVYLFEAGKTSEGRKMKKMMILCRATGEISYPSSSTHQLFKQIIKWPNYSMSLQLYPNRLSFITLFIKWSVLVFCCLSNYSKFLPLFCLSLKYKQYRQKISVKSLLHIPTFSGYMYCTILYFLHSYSIHNHVEGLIHTLFMPLPEHWLTIQIPTASTQCTTLIYRYS